MIIDFIAHLTRQAAFSKATFGPGPRTKGVIDHITKELREVEKVYEKPARDYLPRPAMSHVEGIRAQHGEAAKEWVDVAILGFDGLLRSIAAANPHWTFDRVAEQAVALVISKQGKNELRDWPDWRTADTEKAIEHKRGKHD